MFRILDRKRKVIGLLQSPIEPRIEEAINGMYELYFSVPSSYKGLELEGYIQIENEHEYVIKEIVTHGTNREVVAVMNVEEIFGNSWITFRSVNTNVYDCMREILSGTNWRAVNQSTREVTRSLLGSNTTSWDLISQFCSIYDVEVKFDTYKKEVTIVDRLGGDLGVYFMNELNLKQLNHDSHTHKYITQVIPVGKDGMTIEDINDGRLYVSDYTYTDKKITGIWKADSYNDKQALKEDAQKFLAEMAVPYQTYECLVVDLSKAQGANNFAYNIGDIITLIDNTTNQRVKQRIIKQTRYLIDPSSNTIQIANKNMTFQDYYKRLQLIANMTEQALNGDGTISSDKIEVGDVDFTLKADSITAEHIKANQIFARHIVADNISAEHIKSESIDTRHLKANIINAGHIQAGSIQAGSGIIAEGAIGDAQISNINANKINAGEIDTSKVRVTGRDGFLFIENNTLYVVDNNRQIRVELGSIQDATNFGFIVRGADGQTILIDHNGVKNAGLTDGSVDNRVVSENANISGKKLDINSVIRRINEDGSVKITGTVVQVGETTLDIKMSEQNNKITEQGKKLETQQSQITSNTESIKLKVDNQTYIEDKENFNSTLNKHTSEIEVLQGEIALKVESTDIETALDEYGNVVDSKIQNKVSKLELTDNEIKTSVAETKEKVANSTNLILNSQAIYTLDGISAIGGEVMRNVISQAPADIIPPVDSSIGNVSKPPDNVGGTAGGGINTKPPSIITPVMPPPTTENVVRYSTKIHFIHSGSTGDCILIQTDNGKNIMVDSNLKTNADKVINYLKSLGVNRLDYIVATHFHTDHAEGFPTIFDAIDVRGAKAYYKVPRWEAMPEKEIGWKTRECYDAFINACNKYNVEKISSLSEGMLIKVSETSNFKIYNSSYDSYHDYNAISLGVLFTHGEKKYFLAGDIAPEAQEALTGRIGKVDLLKVPHHGYNSRIYMPWVEELNPTRCIVTRTYEFEGAYNDIGALQVKQYPIYTQFSSGRTIVLTSTGSDYTLDTSNRFHFSNCWCKFNNEENKFYWFKQGGLLAKNETILVHGKKYRFDETGLCLNPYNPE